MNTTKYTSTNGRLTNKMVAGAAGLLIIGLGVPITVAAGINTGNDVEISPTDQQYAEGQARYDECRAGSEVLSDMSTVETRESRQAQYECLHFGWPDWYDTDPAPFELPADWQPDQAQLDWSVEFATWLSGEMTEVGVAHTVVTNDDGAQWVDYDELDPDASHAVDEIIARGDHLPADSAVTTHLAAD